MAWLKPSLNPARSPKQLARSFEPKDFCHRQPSAVFDKKVNRLKPEISCAICPLLAMWLSEQELLLLEGITLNLTGRLFSASLSVLLAGFSLPYVLEVLPEG